MFKKIFAAVVFVAFFVFLTTHSAVSEEMVSWGDCVNEAIQNNPDLTTAKEQYNQAKAEKNIVMSNMLPQITGNAAVTSAKSPPQAKTNTYQYGVSGNQLVFDGFKTAFDVSSATKNVNSYRFNYDVASSSVRLSLRSAFVELLGAQEGIKVAEDIIKRRKYNLDLIRLRYQGGREHKGSLMTAEAALAEANLGLEEAKSSLFVAQQKLVKALGRNSFAPLNANGNLNVKGFNFQQPDFYNLAETNPFLKELIAQRESADLNLKSAKASYFPQVYANATYGKTDSEWPPGQDRWSAGVDLSIPLFQGGLTRAQISKAKSQLGQAKAAEKSGKDKIIVTLAGSWTALKDAIKKVDVQRQYLDAAQTRARIAEAQYSNGLILFDNWTIIEDNLVQAKKSYLLAEVGALVAEATWIQAKGGTLDYDTHKENIDQE